MPKRPPSPVKPVTRKPSDLSRRRLLQGLGAVGVGAAAPGCGGSGSASRGAGGTAGMGGFPRGAGGTAGMGGAAGGTGVGCVLTPEQAEGPFFVDTGLERRDISEGGAGTPLDVRLTLVEVPSCNPIEGAVVELWHTNASGAYSGFDIADGNLIDAAGLTFMRGFQRTDAAGAVIFQTIYPGWYPGRTPHLHLLALVGTNRIITTQLYFDDALTDRVYAEAPYSARGPRDTTNDQDGVSRFGGAAGTGPLLLQTTQEADGYAGTFVIGVQT